MSAKYRVELYFDGRRLSQNDVNVAELVHAYRGAALRDAGVALCYPEYWRQNIVENGRPEAGYAAANGNRGAYAAGFLARRGDDLTEQRRRAVADFVSLTVRDIKQRKPIDIFAHEAQRCASYIPDWDTPHVEYVTPNLSIIAKAWKSPDGLVHVGLVWQRSSTPDVLSCHVLASMTTVDADAAVPAAGSRVARE